MVSDLKAAKNTCFRFSALLIASVLLCCFSFTACKETETQNGSQNPDVQVTAKPNTAPDPGDDNQAKEKGFEFPAIGVSDWTKSAPMPVYHSDIEYAVGEITVRRPVFIGENSARLNAAIRTAFTEYAEEAALASPIGIIEYELVFSDQNLISIWMILRRPLQEEQITGPFIETERRTFNYDVIFGSRIDLQDAFGSTYTPASAKTLASMIEATAAEQGYRLLGELNPIPGDQMFIFVLLNSEDADGAPIIHYGVCFYFRPYELALPSQGCPRVYIGIDALRRFSASNTSVRRLSNATPGKTQ